MRSVFLRRMILVLAIAIVLAVVFLCLGYMYLGRSAYRDIKLQEMLPKAEALEQLLLEYLAGNIAESAFTRIERELSCAADASLFVTDASGNIILADNEVLPLAAEDVRTALSEEIASALSGESVQKGGVQIGDVKNILTTVVPIQSESEISGCLMLIKSNREITDTTGKLNSALFLSIAVVVPLIALFSVISVRRITSPLHRMSEVAIEMSKGNFEIRADDSEQGEPGVLARALNTLCDNLSQTIYQLRTEKGQLNEILSSLTDGVAALDGVGMLKHYNPALMKMFGAVSVTCREDLIADKSIWEAFDRVYETGESETLTVPLPGDKTVWVTISPVTTEEGERTGVVGLFKDMTEMERVEAMRREYVANVSHELRTPLTAVRGLLEPLADGMVKDDETRDHYYRIMLHEVMRLSRLITDMMMLSRLQSGTEYMELTRVDVAELITDLVQGYQSTAQQKGIHLIADAPAVPDALTDSDRVEQVLVILIDNAMRYTPEEGSITVRVRDGERLTVSVEDTGCGIPENDIPHIFERFYKVDKSRREGGTGLGLSIAKFIMEKLGEQITVTSELGKGTVFMFTLKKYRSNAIALGPAHEDWQGTKPTEHATKNVFDMKAKDDGRHAQDAPYEVVPEKQRPKKKEPKNDL